MKQLLYSHMEALKSIRNFWRELLHKDVSFMGLSRAFSIMDTSEARADRVYRMFLERYPKSPKLLRYYGHYLEGVKNDPWSASRYFSEAERLEDMQSEMRNLMTVTDPNSLEDQSAQVDDQTDGVIIASEQGIIQFTNRIVNK